MVLIIWRQTVARILPVGFFQVETTHMFSFHKRAVSETICRGYIKWNESNNDPAPILHHLWVNWILI